MHCIAMAYGDRPLRRFITGQTRKLIYVSSSDADTAPKTGVGFPHCAVYKFDQALLEQLCAARTNGDSREFEKLKSQLTPWRDAHASRG